MKLLSLHIENFGKLSNYDHVFSDGLNVIKHENSWGKTTLATFLKAMFFGMDKKGNLKAYSAERSKYAPWQGGTYGGSVIFEVDGKRYRVLRTFALTPEGDRFELIDLQTNKPSKDFTSSLGEEIFKVGRETFALSTFFPQGELDGKINDEIRSYLSGANDISNDVEMQSKAVKKLKNIEKEYRLSCPKAYEIIALEEQIEDGKAELASLENNREKIKKDIKLLSEKIETCKAPETDTDDNDSTDLDNQILEVEKKLQALQISKAATGRKRLTTKVSALCCVAFGVLSITVAILLACLKISLVCGIVIGAVGGASIIIAAVMFYFLNKQVNQFSKLKKSEETLLIEKQDAEKRYRILADRSAAMLNFAEEKKNIEVQMAVDQTKLLHTEKDISQVLERIDDEETSLALKQTLKSELEEKKKIVQTVIDCLIQAQDNVSKRYVQPMQQQFNEIVKRLSNDKKIILDSDLNIAIDTQSGFKEKAYLSAGNQDMVDICKRFALVKSIFKKQMPFIILDDPFVNLDEISLQNMLKLVKDFAEEMQIVYLVCHESRAGE